MRGKKLLVFSVLLLLITGCNVSSSSNNSTESNNAPSSNSEISSTSSTNVATKKESFMPQVGEVRKWFDKGTIGESQFYNYCPSVFIEDNTKYIYYCTNKDEGNVTDYIGYRTGTYTDHWEYSEENYVLSPTPDTWDQRHTCDPDVIKGEFSYRGESYNYLMAYLGCIPSDCTLNETGIAVSKTPMGPWVKCNDINPLVPYDPDYAVWGTGQPSVVSVDNKGRIIIFTTIGNKNRTYTEAREYDLSNIDDPKLIRSKNVATNGIISSGSNYTIANASFSYDVKNKKIIMAKGRQPFGNDGSSPTFIADTIDVYYMDDSENENMFDEIFKGNNGNNWVHFGTINEELTTFKRNHNNGLVTDSYGHTFDENLIEVAFTRSDLATGVWNYLSTYRIYSTSFELPYVK